MKTAIRCIILLACIIICTSKSILNCRCVKTSKVVKPSLIVHVQEYEPRPYCNKKEVIVVLKDRSSRCLDPKGRFAQAVIEHMQRARLAAGQMKPSAPNQP